jgi:hypothetical protein
VAALRNRNTIILLRKVSLHLSGACLGNLSIFKTNRDAVLANMRFVAYLPDSAVKGSAVQTIACDRKDILSCQNNTGRKRALFKGHLRYMARENIALPRRLLQGRDKPVRLNAGASWSLSLLSASAARSSTCS